MPRLKYEAHAVQSRAGESVLEAFMRQGIEIPFSCRTGLCQVCLRRCVGGKVPEAAQRGVRASLRERGYFLPCVCVPESDMELAAPQDADLYTRATVQSKELVAPDVCRVLLEPYTVFDYRPGQFLNLRRDDGLTRSYSLASVPEEDPYLEIHVKRMRGGAMSGWIFDRLAAGDSLEIQGPQGEGYYREGRPDQRVLMVATGTGLAPLLGVARDALLRGHSGEIHVYHGSHHAAGLYMRDAMLALQMRHPNFRYCGCVSGPEVPLWYLAGRADERAFRGRRDLRGWRVHLAGAPAMVRAAEATALELGAAAADTFADPFDLRDLRRAPRPPRRSGPPDDAPAPDPELWRALGEGATLTAALRDFYARAYADDRLAPFFHGVTQQRAVEKQYLFMRQLITGEKAYFGDRPRNAHHWMVISDDLFDHREALLAQCLRRSGLSEPLIARWRALDERFRRDIVKAAPRKRVVDGVELPLDGYGEAVLEVGTLCDGCGLGIAAGERVRYHLRLGATYCPACAAAGAAA